MTWIYKRIKCLMFVCCLRMNIWECRTDVNCTEETDLSGQNFPNENERNPPIRVEKEQNKRSKQRSRERENLCWKKKKILRKSKGKKTNLIKQKKKKWRLEFLMSNTKKTWNSEKTGRQISCVIYSFVFVCRSNSEEQKRQKVQAKKRANWRLVDLGKKWEKVMRSSIYFFRRRIDLCNNWTGERKGGDIFLMFFHLIFAERSQFWI